MSAGRRDNRAVTDLDSATSMFIKQYRLVLDNLPEPGVEFEASDHIPQNLVKPSRDYGIIKHVGRSGEKRTFETTEKGHKGIQDWMEVEEDQGGFLPCGHDGLTNLGDGKVQCNRQGCKQIHTKAAIKKHNE